MAVSELGAPATPAGLAPLAAVSKWLVVGDSGARLRLPDDTNLERLEIVIRAAIGAASRSASKSRTTPRGAAASC
jgi:hypothetical protein